MPEIPDLEAIRGFLEPRLRGNAISGVETRFPWLVRTGAVGLDSLVGHEFASMTRRGKFLLFAVDDGRVLAVNSMLTGRFHWAGPDDKRRPMTALVMVFDDGHELRYSDQRRMGRFYLVAIDDLASVPQMAELGPDALEVSEEEFVTRLRKRRGQIKNTLTNQKFIAGIGNAYSDEILWQAKLHPHTKGSTLTDEDRAGLYRSMHETFEWAIPLLEAEVQDQLYQRNEEWRAHLRVHRRGGEPCPRCGETVASQTISGRETNYCLHCQPLALA